jgi:hypothetical protein
MKPTSIRTSKPDENKSWSMIANQSLPNWRFPVSLGLLLCSVLLGTPKAWAQPGPVAYSIWNDATVPAILSADDPNAIEVGLKFQSAVNGYITGIRFYKGPSNTGTHVGNLWTSTGTLLGSVTFGSETASGWQQQTLPSPVPINSNTTYVVSYYAPAGGYAADPGYFASSGVDNYPLRALANGEDGPNGVFIYSASSAFPNETYNAANYWVDVVMPVQDNTPPTITCATNKLVECGTAWSFDEPSATDNGAPAAVEIVSTVTNVLCGGAMAATRTWQATNGSGNTATCSQTVTVVDTTPPSLTCPSGMLLEFQDEKGAVATYSVPATDVCSAVTVVLTPPSGSLFPIGVTPVHVQAADACGNSNQCSFDVTVLGARGVKSNILAELVALRRTSANRIDRWELDEAIGNMIAALGLKIGKAPLWVDETHVDRRNGDWVFIHEEDAVNELLEILNYKNSQIPDATVQNLIQRLVKADRLLAVVSIRDATRAGLNSKKIAKALRAVAKGDQDAARGKPDRAIEDYRDAWDEAVHLKVKCVIDPVSRKMQLEFVGAGNQVYAIEASTNLVDWVKVGTCTADAAGNVKYADPGASKHSARFYRVVSQ